MKRVAVLMSIALLAMACGDEEQTLGGEPFTFVSGNAVVGSGDRLTINLAGYEEEDPCSVRAFSQLPHIWWFAENKTGTQDLGLGNTVVFQVKDGDDDTLGTSNNVTSGHYTINTIGPDVVSGSLLAEGFDDFVEFDWEVPLCD